MAALLKKQTPLLVQLPTGALVPVNGMATGAVPAPAAADMNGTGALVDPHVVGAGQQGAVVAPAGLAPDTTATALGIHDDGGAAKGALISHPDQPKPLEPVPTLGSTPGGADPTSGADGGLAALLKLGKAAGQSGGEGTTAATGGNDDSGGVMGFLHGLFNGGDSSGASPATPDPQQVQTPDIASALPDLSQPGATPIAANSNDQGPALGVPVDAPVPTARPFNLGDQVTPQQVTAPDSVGALAAPQPGDISAATPALPDQQEPGYFDRLKSNPVALALLTGGLQTMSAASRPGATIGGSIGEGALGGIKTVFEQQAAEKERALAERRQDTLDASEASQQKLRGQQGAFYDARTTEAPVIAGAKVTTADAAGKRADAAGKTADAAGVRAAAYAAHAVGPGASKPTALMQNAKFYVDNGVAPDVKTATQMLRTGVNDATTYQRLVQAEKKVIQGSTDGMAMSDKDQETLAQANVKARAASAQPASSGPALGGKTAPPAAGALESQARAAINKGADPAKVNARLKQMGGNPGAL